MLAGVLSHIARLFVDAAIANVAKILSGPRIPEQCQCSSQRRRRERSGHSQLHCGCRPVSIGCWSWSSRLSSRLKFGLGSWAADDGKKMKRAPTCASQTSRSPTIGQPHLPLELLECCKSSRLLAGVHFATPKLPSMKIKALSRSASSAQAPGSNVAKVTRNLDPNQHPFERAREYTRALNATKVERMFASPFVGDFEPGHVDGVYSFAKDPNSLEHFASGSGDGVVKVWDFTSREEKWQAQAHENLVKGMCWTRDKKLITCGADRQVQLFEPYSQASKTAPKATWHGNAAFTSVSHHRTLPSFAAASSTVSIYDTTRTSGAPVQSMVWPSAIDTINHVSFNQVETSILASCATDRAIILYDLRTGMPLHRTVLNFASNCISWNPMEAYNFAVANEDHNAYVSTTMFYLIDMLLMCLDI
jgi:hypothetical protein